MTLTITKMITRMMIRTLTRRMTGSENVKTMTMTGMTMMDHKIVVRKGKKPPPIANVHPEVDVDAIDAAREASHEMACKNDEDSMVSVQEMKAVPTEETVPLHHSINAMYEEKDQMTPIHWDDQRTPTGSSTGSGSDDEVEVLWETDGTPVVYDEPYAAVPIPNEQRYKKASPNELTPEQTALVDWILDTDRPGHDIVCQFPEEGNRLNFLYISSLRPRKNISTFVLQSFCHLFNRKNVAGDGQITRFCFPFNITEFVRSEVEDDKPHTRNLYNILNTGKYEISIV